MAKYTDNEIRNMPRITLRIAGDYLGISPLAVGVGMRNNLLPIRFAVHNEERDRSQWSESWSYHIVPERMIAIEDEYLGRREHSKSKEEKNLDKKAEAPHEKDPERIPHLPDPVRCQ